ncbi:MAG: MarC family protein [Candidatus Woesearchaeota archaeon]|jgi:multiple antibiotic resistance protein
MFYWLDFVKAFFALFVVMDAIGNIPIFALLEQKCSLKKQSHDITSAIYVAGALLLAFLFFGSAILLFFGITITSFKIAGGIILGILGIKLVLGIKFREKRAEEYEVAIVPLATPLITGPGVITTVIILVNQYGYIVTLVVSLLNLLITWFALRHANLLLKYIGKQGADAMTKIMGLILAAMGVNFILSAFGLA